MTAGPRDTLIPAPGRGQYDRAQSRVERQAEQRERLVHAATVAFASGPVTVARIVAVAGVGRNTFYEYFDDPEHALAVAESRALARLEARVHRELESARTPLETLRALARAWFTELDANSLEFRLALRAGQAALSPAGRSLSELLARAIDEAHRRAGIVSRPSALKVTATAAAAEAFGRARLGGAEPLQHEAELADIMGRLLR